MTNRSLPLFTITLASVLASRAARGQQAPPTFVPANPYAAGAITTYDLPGSSAAPPAARPYGAPTYTSTRAPTPNGTSVTTVTTGGTAASAATTPNDASAWMESNPYRAATPTPTSTQTAASNNASAATTTAGPSSAAPPSFTTYRAARGPGPLPLRCTPPVMLPIRSQLGRDGNWHVARAPEAPPARAIGGGPVDPSCQRDIAPEEDAASASSSPPAASDVASTASAAPTDLATSEISASGAPVGVPDATDTTLETVHVESASSLHRVRGGGPADVDAYSLTYLNPRPRPRVARFMLGFGGGTGMYTAENDGRNLGANWYAGLGLEVARVLTIEGRYQGAHNVVPIGLDPSGSYGVLANGVTGLVRLALPTPYVSPYVQSGLGYLWFATTGAPRGQGTVAPSGLTNFPVGGGVEFRFTRGVGLDLEYNYQFLIDSRWTLDHASHPWGDLWNATAAMRFYL